MQYCNQRVDVGLLSAVPVTQPPSRLSLPNQASKKHSYELLLPICFKTIVGNNAMQYTGLHSAQVVTVTAAKI